MPTYIHMLYKGVPKDILPSKFAKIRKNPDWVVDDNGFTEFRDTGPRGIDGLIIDIDIAIKNKCFGPSWNQFIQALVDGSIIMIITARGHEPMVLQNAVKHIIQKYLTQSQKVKMLYGIKKLIKAYNVVHLNKGCIDWYLDQCLFMGVYSKAFEETFNINLSTIKSEKAKEFILNYFITQLNQKNKELGYKFKVGMSDDDTANINSIKKFFSQSNWSNVIGLYVYDTSNPKHVIKTKYD
jgi:hypothetical protein